MKKKSAAQFEMFLMTHLKTELGIYYKWNVTQIIQCGDFIRGFPQWVAFQQMSNTMSTVNVSVAHNVLRFHKIYTMANSNSAKHFNLQGLSWEFEIQGANH